MVQTAPAEMTVSSIEVGFSPGEVKISSRIKVHPPLPRSRDFLPSGGRFEIDQCFQQR